MSQQAPTLDPAKLKSQRVLAGLTRTQLAFHTDRAEQTVWLWERGHLTPRLETVYEIARVLGCDVHTLFNVETPTEPR